MNMYQQHFKTTVEEGGEASVGSLVELHLRERAEEAEAKLKRSGRKLEEGQELAAMLRAALAGVVEERDAAVAELEAAKAPPPVSPAPESLFSALAEGTYDTELSELESALNVASGLLDGMDADTHLAKRLAFSPGVPVKSLHETKQYPTANPWAMDPELSCEFNGLTAEHLEMAEMEQQRNRMAAAKKAGLGYEQYLLLAGGTPEARASWDEVGDDYELTSVYTHPVSFDIDHLRVRAVVDSSFLAPIQASAPEMAAQSTATNGHSMIRPRGHHAIAAAEAAPLNPFSWWVMLFRLRALKSV